MKRCLRKLQLPAVMSLVFDLAGYFIVVPVFIVLLLMFLPDDGDGDGEEKNRLSSAGEPKQMTGYGAATQETVEYDV